MSTRIKKYAGHLIVAAMLLGAGYSVYNASKSRGVVRPQNASEFAQTSAMITVKDESSGGSGVILKSGEKESIILTNKHVCEVIQGGGVVNTSGKKYKITAFKIYKKHDLCMVKVAANLKITTVVAEKQPKLYSHVFVSGHPSLLPHVLTEGYFSNFKTVSILVDVKKCTEDNFKEDPMSCMFLGGIPIIRDFESQLVTATIMPGSSGSGVFNEAGEISGLVFAGSAQGLSYGFIVPLKSVQDFIANEAKYKWRKPYVGANANFLVKLIDKKIQIGCQSNKLYSDSCGQVERGE